MALVPHGPRTSFFSLNVHGQACSSRVPPGVLNFFFMEMGKIRVSMRVAHTLYFLY